MDIDLQDLSPGAAYALMTQTILPRPVAWVLTENADGSHNVAPFSYFTAVTSRPPTIAISVGRRPDGTLKDTLANVQERPRLVVHIASWEQVVPLNDTAQALEPGQSEADAFDLPRVPFDGSPLPRLADAPVAMACHLDRVEWVGDTPQGLVLAVIDRVWVDDRLVSTDARGRFAIDAVALDPVARLGGRQYGRLRREILELARE